MEYEYQPEEMLPVLRWQVKQNPIVRYLRILMVGVGAVGVLLLAVGVTIRDGTALVVAGSVAVVWAILELLVLRWGFRRGERRAWATLSEAGPRTMAFSDEGIHVKTTLTTAMNSWGVYSETLERNGMYLLRLARVKSLRAYAYVPKRAFKSADDEGVFRQLVSAHTEAHLTSSQHNNPSSA